METVAPATAAMGDGDGDGSLMWGLSVGIWEIKSGKERQEEGSEKDQQG